MIFDRLSGLGAAVRVARTLIIAGAALAIGSAAYAKPAAAPAAQSAAKADAPAAKDVKDIEDVKGTNTTTVSGASDDVVLFQRDVRVTKTGAGKVVVMGKDITFAGADAKTVVAMGETVRFESGASHQELVAGGETVDLTAGFKVDDDAAVFGKRVTVSAPVGGDLNAAGETVTIDSAVTGSVKVEGEHVIIGPNARIGGDLKYRADKLEISPQAVITGKQTKLVGPARHGMHSNEPKTVTQQVVAALWGAAFSAALAFGAMLLLPGLVGRGADALAKNPLMPLAIGLVTLIGVPILIVLCAITIIGFPVAIMLGLLYGASFFLALATASATLGGLIRGLMAKKGEPGFGGRLGWAVLGGVILALLGAIPVAGGWISLAACVLGMGAVVGALRKS